LSSLDGAQDKETGIEDARTDDDAGTDNKDNDADNDIVSKRAPTGGRNRQLAKTCPETATPPRPVIPRQSSRQVVMAFLSASSAPLTVVKTLVPAMAKRVCSAGSVAKIDFSCSWRPKTDTGKF